MKDTGKTRHDLGREEFLKKGIGGGGVYVANRAGFWAFFKKFTILPPVRWGDGMRCFRGDWPWLCLFCCYQPSCVVSQQRRFGLFCFINFPILPPPPQCGSGPTLTKVLSSTSSAVSHPLLIGTVKCSPWMRWAVVYAEFIWG